MSSTGLERGRVRPPGREGLLDSDEALLEMLVDWEPLHTLAAQLPTPEPGAPGRPCHFPPVALLLYGIMAWGDRRSTRRAERLFRKPSVMALLQRRLGPRYPNHRGLQPGAKPVTRSHWRTFSARFKADPDLLDLLGKKFTELMAGYARAIGLLDPTKGSLTHPASENLTYGDVTILRSLYKYQATDQYIHPTTGEKKTRRHDPDARFGQAGGKGTVWGTPIGILGIGVPDHESVNLILSMYEVDDHQPGGTEGERAVATLADIKQNYAPEIAGIVYDKALRGTHRVANYANDLLTITKIPRAAGGAGSKQLGDFPANTPNGPERVYLMAIDGAPYVQVITGGNPEYVRLDRVKLIRRRNKSGPPRWYGRYRIPSDPRVPTRLVGATVTVRLDKPAWADQLSPIPPGDGDWGHAFGLRNRAESINSWFKDFTRGRAPCMGRKRQRLAFLCGALMANFQALLRYCRKRDLDVLALTPKT